MAEKATNKILIPSGMQPRVAIAYLLFPLIKLLNMHRILDTDYKEVPYLLKSHKLAKEIANEIDGLPIIYGYGVMASIAKRWRQQLNENAKMMAFDFALPENNLMYFCLFFRSLCIFRQ